MESLGLLLSGLSFDFNVLLAIVAWFLRETYNTMKDRQEKTEEEIKDIHKHYTRRDDFAEFKKELFDRLDRMHEDFNRERRTPK